MVVTNILQALWFVWPAYTANAFPTILNGKIPLDGNRLLKTHRILGSSKTLEGTAGGILFGVLMGLLQINVYSYLPSDLGLLQFTMPMIILLSVGALTGDIMGSFIKRRLDYKPGEPAILLDQLGFLVMAMAFVSAVFIPSIQVVAILVVITPAIHLLTNIVGYILKLKKNPW